jgi:hypothetical protein
VGKGSVRELLPHRGPDHYRLRINDTLTVGQFDICLERARIILVVEELISRTKASISACV